MINFRIGSFSILPFDKMVIESKLNIAEASVALHSKVDLKSGLSLFFSNKSSNKEFRGVVNNYTFNITRIISYRNSFLPVISGKIERNTYNVGGSQISITMRMNWFVMIFGVIWMGVVTLVGGLQIVNLIDGDEINGVSLLMFLFGFFLINGGFSYEANKARKLLLDILEGEEL